MQTRYRTRPALLAVFLLSAGLVAYAAQPPEVEDPKGKVKKKVGVENEDPKGTIKKKVVVDDPDTPPKGTQAPATAPDSRLDEVVQAAERATNPALKALLGRFVVPFDRITDSRGVNRIRPIPLYWKDRTGFPKEFGVSDLDAQNQPGPLRNASLADIKKLEHFEEIALAEATQLLKQKPLGTEAGPAGMAAEDQLAAAEKILAAALRFHDYARDNPYPGGKVNIRSGKNWDEVRKPLVTTLREVRLKQLERATTASDWPRARSLGSALMNAYPKDDGVAQAVAAARVAEAQVLMGSTSPDDHIRARELLDEFLAKFPGGGGEPVRKLRADLTREAERRLDRATKYKASGDIADAQRELDIAEKLDPTVPGLQDLKRGFTASYKVLYVGVRRFPELMSPATARFDSERQAVELSFEGMLEEVPTDRGGTRYRLGAALTFPTVLPGGRELLLRQVEPPDGGQGGFNAHDVVETVRLMRTRPELWVSAGLPWLDDLPAPAGGGVLRLAFKSGHPDPRALLTFKVLPGRYLTSRGRKIDDDEFARRPFGTGPFRFHSSSRIAGTEAREMVFVENPEYRRWKDREGQPLIQEVRFIEVGKLAKPLDEFRAGRLHLLPDLSPEEIKQFLSEGNELTGKGQIVATASTRRVHILAINHRRPGLQNKSLRKGLSQAIDRAGILGELLAGLKPEYRRISAPMSGPFPPTSWATPKGPTGQPVPLLDPGGAIQNLGNFCRGAGNRLQFDLAYAKDDPFAASACAKIKAQVEGMCKDFPQGKLVLNLQPVEPAELYRWVVGEFRYDLAYIPFDYPDDWHPYGLAAFLDPAAGGGWGRNYTGFLAPGSAPDQQDRLLGQKLMELYGHRDFAGQIVPRAKEIHDLFNESVPFVPLWQLDRHMLVHNGLRVHTDDSPEPTPPYALDPTTLFQGVGRWRLVKAGG